MPVNYLDVAFLAILGLFLLRGLFRGLVEEVAGLVGVIGGVYLANKHNTEMAPYIHKVVADNAWVGILSYVLIFLAVLILVALVARMLRSILAVTFASWLDHVAGGLAGGAKGLLICSVLLALLMHFLPDAQFVKESRVIPYLSEITTLVRGYLPKQIL